jgi:hypothetical protein
MGGGERGMSAQFDFHGRRKPAEMKNVIFAIHKRRFRQVHFQGDILHPYFIGRAIHEAHRRRVAMKRFFGKGIYLDNLLRHEHSFGESIADMSVGIS